MIKILIRGSLAEQEEIESAKKYFGSDVFESRAKLLAHLTHEPIGSLIISRYASLPYFKEFQEEVEIFGGKLINSYTNHRYVADIANWYPDLEEYTFKTWFRLEDVPKDGGPFILKGETNSKKFQWQSHCYAQNFKEASEVYQRLYQDSLISQQNIVIRQFEPLKKLADAVVGPPVSEEYRFFVLDGHVICGAFYWSTAADDLEVIPSADNVPKDYLENIIDIVAQKIRFFVVDVARKENGDWVVVELNDGCQSGLSCNTADDLYAGLKNKLRLKEIK